MEKKVGPRGRRESETITGVPKAPQAAAQVLLPHEPFLAHHMGSGPGFNLFHVFQMKRF